MEQINLTTKSWRDYELLDSGDNRKLERYGDYIVIRPETQALWKPAHAELWKRAHAEFRSVDGKGIWQKKNMPESWQMSWEDITCIVRLTSFKHTGVFPEQAANWEWLRERVGKLHEPHVLNLFGYTGIASIVAAKAGAKVTHVDASKQSNAWAKENANLSGIPADRIRYITDDALKFAEREVRRGASYDGIILDPPAFGRGAKGEVWKIEESFPRLLVVLKQLWSKKPGAFFLLNGYAAGYSPLSFVQATENVFSNTKGEFGPASTHIFGEAGELRIQETNSERCISSGIYVRFVG